MPAFKDEILQAFRASVQQTGAVPLTWVAATREQAYVNVGDALSAVMVSLLSGLPVRHTSHNSRITRMAAVGTIGHSLVNGDIVIWGTGSSRYRNPFAPLEQRIPVGPMPGTRLSITATRGPISRQLLGEDNAATPPAYGDPVWLLPQFYPAPRRKKWKLGVIIHLADLQDRGFEPNHKADHKRYVVPDEFRSDIRLINTIAPIGIDGLRAKLDEILSCERLVSTSLHGMVFAESYGIPCLYFSPRTPRGLHAMELDPDGTLDLRIVDLYRGLGLARLPVYGQPRREPTDWRALMDTIDRAWKPLDFDPAPLLDAFPLELNPIRPHLGETVFDHPLLGEIPFQHSAYTAVSPGKVDNKSAYDRLRRWIARGDRRLVFG
jgi:hypothetical protein